uniref:Uncharacterized protein n=1 Tax=viral metagenome TaxID=1070528 RepID=A0A6H1ZHJ9_9ZZZZ
MNDEQALVKHEEQQLSTLELTKQDVSRTINNIKLLRELKKEVLKKGVHYYAIKTKDKKSDKIKEILSLSKAGAEIMLNSYNCYAKKITEETRDLGYNHFSIEFEVGIYFRPTQQLVSTGVGSCNSKENKYTYIKYNPNEVRNACRKMAFKRALVDATLYLANMSEFFSQDIEEMDIENKLDDEQNPYMADSAVPGTTTEEEATEPPQEAGSPDPAAPSSLPITAEMEKTIRKYIKEHDDKISPDYVITELGDKFNVKRIKDLTLEQADQFLALLKENCGE